MSVIENALKKLQQSSRPADGAGAPAAISGATAANAAPRRRSETGHEVALTPRRTIPVDLRALEAGGLLSPAERHLEQQYRAIKRPLLAVALGRGTQRLPQGNLIMVTSAMPGEGKTFISLNLAFSMTLEKDLSVLLVDADVAKPRISKVFGVAGEPGLLDALADPALDIESLVMPTTVTGLSILPAGSQSTTATELLSSARMRALLAGLSSRDPSRIVLFDSPPLLLTTESQALVDTLGQIVLVVRSGITPQRAVQDALAQLGEGRSVGLVLNQSTRAPDAGYYYSDDDRRELTQS